MSSTAENPARARSSSGPGGVRPSPAAGGRLADDLAQLPRAEPSSRLVALDDYVRRLRRFRRTSESDYVADPAVHDLAARYLHMAMEAALDIANHWISTAGLRTPESNRDSFVVLEEAGELDPALSERLQGWAGFRDALVHDYLDLDHGIAWRAIRDDLGDLDAFRRWALGKLDPGRELRPRPRSLAG